MEEPEKAYGYVVGFGHYLFKPEQGEKELKKIWRVVVRENGHHLNGKKLYLVGKIDQATEKRLRIGLMVFFRVRQNDAKSFLKWMADIIWVADKPSIVDEKKMVSI